MGWRGCPSPPLLPHIAALPPLPWCISSRAPPLPVPLLCRRDTTRGRDESASLGPIRSRQGGPPQWSFASGQVYLEGSREGGQGEAGHGESKGTRRARGSGGTAR